MKDMTPNQRDESSAIDYREAAHVAGLVYVNSDQPGLSRRRAGKGFAYADAQGRRVTDPAALARIRALAIPPAWTGVWICADPNGHIQAVGRDARGRKQYRYHARFREVRDRAKYEHMLAFAQALPRLRRQVAAHMAEPNLGRAKVLATVVHLLETTMIRVGNPTYAKANKSYGLTTLLSRQVKVEGSELKFEFKGKSGKMWRLGVRDRRIARIVKTCQELPGQHLFQYLDSAGQRQAVTSADVNAYLKEVSGADITAKDFRTWTGTVLAAVALADSGSATSQAQAKSHLAQAIKQVSATLGNTPTICRKCYVHPQVISAYLQGGLRLDAQTDAPKGHALESLYPQEAAVLSFLRACAANDEGVDRPTDAAHRPGRPTFSKTHGRGYAASAASA